ncbi:MAG TPA: TRAP transporter small permease [Ureibacillus sp.]|nr:TRAP transporter small permease [Ureibacillus sp.]
MKIVRKINNFVFSIEKILAILLAVVLLLSLAAGVLFRYLLKSPLFWSDELAIFCLIWITFIGGSLSLKEKASPSITILTDLVSPKLKKYVQALCNIILLLFVAYILYLAYEWITMPNIMVQTSTAMNIPKVYFYLSIPVSFIFSVIHVLANIFLDFTEDEQEGSLQ